MPENHFIVIVAIDAISRLLQADEYLRSLLAREAVDTLFFASGASSIQAQVPIQRFHRDIQALANHAIMHAPTAMELYGRVLCGLEPNTLLY